jgi:predicted secreted protein
MKIRPVTAELFHADGQIDITKLIVAFRNFAKSPKIDQSRVCEKAVNIYQSALLTTHRTTFFVVTTMKISNLVYLQYFTVSNKTTFELSQIKSSNCPTIKGMICLRSTDINHTYML